MEEIWKDIIIDNENTGWKVSNLGRCKRLNGEITYGSTNDNGYKYVCIKDNNYKVHRLVAQAFIPNPENKPDIDHKNTIRNDNNISNLNWVTKKENMNNPITKQKLKFSKKKQYQGSKNPKARKVKCIETGEIFECAKDAALKYKLELCSVSHSANIKHPQKTAGGYHWEYLS